MTNTFQSFNLKPELITALTNQSITEPMPIQILSIPAVLEGKDIIASSHTGSGKTLAYLLPIFEKIDTSLKQSQVIILAPTHELVAQINDTIKSLVKESGLSITSAIMMGNMNIEKQIKTLKTKPHIIVGSSGRVLELIKKKKLSAHTIKRIILDEADNLLEKNQAPDIQEIIKSTLRDTQIMLFSATINPTTKKVAESFLKAPLVLNTSETTLLNPNIKHFHLTVEQRKKFETLRKLLNTLHPQKALIFVNNIHEVEIIVNKLVYHHKEAAGLFGSQTKQQRQQTLDQFRSGKINILVSSDLSARGLDISDISHVFNMDLPPSSLDYLHRAGRTARGHNSGTAICLITNKEQATIKEYSKKLGISIESLK